jgi:hypothetical protein
MNPAKTAPGQIPARHLPFNPIAGIAPRHWVGQNTQDLSFFDQFRWF